MSIERAKKCGTEKYIIKDTKNKDYQDEYVDVYKQLNNGLVESSKEKKSELSNFGGPDRYEEDSTFCESKSINSWGDKNEYFIGTYPRFKGFKKSNPTGKPMYDINFYYDYIKNLSSDMKDSLGVTTPDFAYSSGGKKSRRKTRSSKKSNRKSSKKSHRKSRRGGKSRRGRR